ncbi:universal stress protein A [Allostella sp. ATCC 35155]|nr:universal stress protein A [Stella sp. ATCC 35155]
MLDLSAGNGRLTPEQANGELRMATQILVPVHTHLDGNAETLADHAVAVARHRKAELHALVLDADFPALSSPLGNLLIDVPALVGEAKAKAHQRGVAVAAALAREAGKHDVPLRTTRIECYPMAASEIVTRLARYHDLTLVGIGTRDAWPQATAEAATFGSGKPVLLVPEERPVAPAGTVVIAWDGSRVAARAVADAAPFLALATRVVVASVIDEKALADGDAAERLVDHLARHGVAATVARIRAEGSPIAAALQEHAAGIDAGLLVMGGFGHSRMRDFVLGGATSGVLKDPRLPILLSH